MYKYYKELENRENFKTTLCDFCFGQSEMIRIQDSAIPVTFFESHKSLFKEIGIVDLLIKSCNERLLASRIGEYDSDYWNEYLDFLDYKQEFAYILDYFKSKLSWNAFDLREYFKEYLYYVERLMILYPKYKLFLTKIGNQLKKSINDLNVILTIKLPKKDESFEYTWPDSWYITPNGYLYNSGGEQAHKEGNLIYAYNRIRSNLRNEKIAFQVLDDGTGRPGTIYTTWAIPAGTNNKKIEELLNRGYVTYDDFIYYTNINYHFPQIITSTLGEMNGEKSYQKSLITIIVGYMAAESSFYRSFDRIRKSENSIDCFNSLENLTAHDLDDILVRFSGFHKISRISERTITTSSIDGIEKFREYLENGWTLEILPPIIYDAYLDRVVEINLNSIYVGGYLNKKLDDYQGKGRILVKK